jgi:hypothetical protein
MNFPDWAKTQARLAPEIVYAGNYLDHHGQIFGHDFSTDDAVDKAAKVACEFLDEAEEWERQIRRIRWLGYSDWT